MKNPDPGYLLPAGEAYTDDFACQLIFIPRKDEYYRAMLGALFYMSTWTAWQRDSDKRGKDAAQAWREANELTMECWRMTCLEDITERMDIIINLLSNQQACCESWTVGPVITVITNITPGVGPDPTEWGETAVADWEEWLEYVCYHAHLYVDTLINSAKALDLAVELGSYTIEFFSAILATMKFMTLGHPVGISDVMEIYDDFRDAVDLIGEFDGLADRFEAARDDIVCAILQGSSLSDAIETAVDNNLIWLLFYVWTDYTSVQALIYEGTVDGSEYLPPVKRDDCLCEELTDFHYTWDVDRQGWNVGVQMNHAWNAGHQALEGYPRDVSSWMKGGNQTVAIIETEFGMEAPIDVRRVKYRVRFEANGEAQIDMRHRIEIQDDTFVWRLTDNIRSTEEGWENWTDVEHIFPATYELREGVTCILNVGFTDTAITGQRIVIDDLRFFPTL